MKVAIITTHGQESSRYLCEGMVAAGIEARAFDLKREYVDGAGYDYVFSYGTSEVVGKARKKRYNSPVAVETCVDKEATFRALRKAGIPTCESTTDKKVARKWGFAVCRENVANRRNEGMTYWYAEDGDIPDAALYTKWFDHIREYRVVVFDGQTFIYFKSTDKETGLWNLNYRPCNGPWLWRMCEHALKAAKSIGIDYVGFDVLMNAKGEVCFLEANSSAVLCDEVRAAIINHFKGLK